MGVRETKKKATAERILAVASNHFLNMPYRDVNLAMISKEVGIAEGTLYNYFKDKTTLFLSAFQKAVVIDKSPPPYQVPSNRDEAIEIIISALDVYLRMDDDRLSRVFKSFYHHQKGQLLEGDQTPYDALEAITAPLYQIIYEAIRVCAGSDGHDLWFMVIKRQIEGIYEAYLYLDWTFEAFIHETQKHLEMILPF